MIGRSQFMLIDPSADGLLIFAGARPTISNLSLARAELLNLLPFVSSFYFSWVCTSTSPDGSCEGGTS